MAAEGVGDAEALGISASASTPVHPAIVTVSATAHTSANPRALTPATTIPLGMKRPLAAA
ncbi:hypothetical protein [Leifsonia sp. RAF41]|uniref:hypothetical protein n=1 Tax=Leifsonia sp. RAF41 TaxID=3233056 RepID=UPI003F987B56